MKRHFLILALALAVATSGSARPGSAQPGAAQPGQDDLTAEIAAMDTALFDAVNGRDLEKLKTMFTADLEFYHDKAGLTNYAQNIAASRETQNIAASRENFAAKRRVRRDLVAGSMRVYPVPKHGAIQTGEHRFCDLAGDASACGVFKFVHIWQRTADGWKLSRVVSFDH